MPYLTITTQKELNDLLERLQDAPMIAYDTEFISEGRYYAQLCLVQIAAGDLLALVDPISVGNLDSLWNLFCDGRHEMIVHACRSELEFCHRAIGRVPPKLFDVQVAAGFFGSDYPAGFRTLVDRILGIDIVKAESRTLWNKRPLTARQIEYALEDVRPLEAMAGTLKDQLNSLDRLHWFEDEMCRIKETLQHDFETPRWRHLPKSTGLHPRELAVLRAVWFWREEQAKKRNIPASRFLRDDLVVELAKRKTDDPHRIAALRGFQGNGLARSIPEISNVIAGALALPTDKLPGVSERLTFPQYSVMSQFLYAALCSICKQEKIAPHLVGGPGDVRELIACELGTLPEGIKPKLLEGWRAKLVGTRLDQLLRGETMIRLDPNRPDDPLVFVMP